MVVHGYQFEIDPSDHAWTGGIYSRRGWLYFDYNPEGQKAGMKMEQRKNRSYRQPIRTWVNGVECANLHI